MQKKTDKQTERGRNTKSKDIEIYNLHVLGLVGVNWHSQGLETRDRGRLNLLNYGIFGLRLVPGLQRM